LPDLEAQKLKTTLIVSVLAFVVALYAYCFSWHDYCVDAKDQPGRVFCIYEPQIEYWFASPNSMKPGLLAAQQQGVARIFHGTLDSHGAFTRRPNITHTSG
jgi:hypothetical protein